MRFRPWLKSFFFFLVYTILLLTSLMWLFRKRINWGQVFLIEDTLKIGILLSSIGTILLIALVTSFVHYILLRQAHELLLKQLEWLSVGRFQHPVFTKKPFAYEWLPYNLQLQQQLILRLRDKMLAVSTELQRLSTQPTYISGEMKEDILTKERHRIARELHDSVSQQLFAAMMMLSALNEQVDEQPFAKSIQMVEKIINESQAEMRALLLHLRPTSLENKTIKEGITALLTELKTKVQMKIIWDIDEIAMTPEIEDHLFRIVQELLSNTLRHAKASQVDVYLKQSLEWISLRVVDDGIGFDSDVEQSNPGSYGLMNIRERVLGMGGTLKIVSFPNRGAIVEIRIPRAINGQL